jgi:hypothetical protein
LGYNAIQKGVLTLEALVKHINKSQLRHLGSVCHDLRITCLSVTYSVYPGMAHNELSKKVLSGVLDTVVRNSTLTSLDFASNDFKISQKEYLNESIKTFLRDNTTVRQIDLSNNKYVLHAS